MEYNTNPNISDNSTLSENILKALNVPIVLIDEKASIHRFCGDLSSYLENPETGAYLPDVALPDTRNAILSLSKNLHTLVEPIEVTLLSRQAEKQNNSLSKIKLTPLYCKNNEPRLFLLHFERELSSAYTIKKADATQRRRVVIVQQTIAGLCKKSTSVGAFLRSVIKASDETMKISEKLFIGITYKDKYYKSAFTKKVYKTAGFVSTDEFGNDIVIDFLSRYTENGSNVHNYSQNDYQLFEVFTNSISTAINEILVRRKLAESEAKLNSIYESEPECVKVVSRDGILIDMNPAGLSMIEADGDPGLAMGKKVIHLIHPEDKAIFQNLHDNALQGQKTTARFRVIGLKGTERWMESTSVPLKLSSDNDLSVLSLTRDITSKIKEEEHLRLLENVIAQTNDAVVITDATPVDKGGPKVIYVNKAFTELTGFEAEEVLGKPSRITTETYTNRPEIVKLFEAIKQGKSCEFTTLNYKKTGEEFWAGISVSPVYNENREITYWLAIEKDVTAHVTEDLQEKLQADIRKVFSGSSNFKDTLEEVLNQIGVCFDDQLAEIWLKGIKNKHLNHVALYANDKISKCFIGSNSEKKIKTGVGFAGHVWALGSSTIWQKDDIYDKFALHGSFIKSGINSLVGIPLRHHDEFIGVLVVGSTCSIQPNSVKYQVLQSLEQILGTEIKRNQQEEELRLLFDCAPEILAIASPDGHFTKANPTFCDLLGYTEEEIISYPFEKFIHPDDLKSSLTEYSDNVSGVSHADNYINRYKTKSGSFKWISWCSSKAFGEDGHMFAFGRDVTKIIKLEQLLENTTKLARVGSWELDLTIPDNDSMFWTPMIKEIFEVEQHFNATIRNGLKFFTVKSKELGLNAIDKLIKTGENFDLELLLNTAKGNKRWIRAIGKSERLNGKCIRIFGSFQDIHDQKLIKLALAEKTEQLKAITKIISTFLQHEDWFTALSENFKIAGTLLDVDRICYFENHLEPETNNKLYSQKFEWSKSSDVSHMNNPFLQNIPFEVFSDFIDPLEQGGIFKATTSSLPNGPLKKVFEFQFIKSAISIPIFIDHHYYGYIGFDDCNKERDWTEDEIDFMLSIASNLATAIQRRLNRLELEEAYLEKSTILESIGDGFFAVDNDWTVSYWNNMAEKLLQTPKETILEKNLWDVFTENVDSVSYKNYSKAMEKGQVVNFEDYFEPLDKWFEISAYPSGKGLAVFFKDISERKLSEEQLRLSNERFEKVSQATSDAIWDWDAQNNTLFWGPGYLTLFGHDHNQPNLKIDKWKSLIHPDEADEVYNSVQNALKDVNLSKWENQYRLRKSDGSYAHVHDQGIIIRNCEGLALRMIGAITDITSQKKYEQSLNHLNDNLEKQARELAISNEELEQFAYVASHDLQEPLRMVTSFLTQLNRKYGDQLDEKAKKYIHFAVDGAKRMRQIILDLLEFSRIGKQDKPPERFAVADIVNEVELLYRRLIQSKKATIEKHNLPEIDTYYGPVLQVFQNIVGNSLKYSKSGVAPNIKINCEERKHYWEFSISDNGIGIQEEYFDRIFVIFQRLHTKGEIDGTGMGLSIVKKIIENLGGTVWLKSTHGKGSIFYFTIPKQCPEKIRSK